MEETQSSLFYNSASDFFPSHKTKILKTARSSDHKYFAKPMDSNSQTEKSPDLTPLKDNDFLTFSDLDSRMNENQIKDDLMKKRIDILETTINDLKGQVDFYKDRNEAYEKNEIKLKTYVANLLDVNNKLTEKAKAKENLNGFNTIIKPNENKMDVLEKEFREINEEREILHNQKIELNQKLENLIKKDILKEKTIDFYKNRIKLYQFKLQNIPRSEKQEIKYLEEYIMKLLGENSKLNKALEKSEKESRKWKEKYFDFEQKKDLISKIDENDFNTTNEKKIDKNQIKNEETTAKSIPIFDSFWSCKPEKR